IGHIINEWYLSIVFRPYFIFPYDAIYCDGPICRMGLPNRLLIFFEYFFSRWQIVLSIVNIFSVLLIILGWAFFARDCDDASTIMEEGEIQWLMRRGGTIFMFGRSGSPQYFQFVLFTIFSQIIILVKKIRKVTFYGPEKPFFLL
ncbi:hypothetical protein PMAYCL1PPCAC_15774, partial [Pristionchus mayeri]